MTMPPDDRSATPPADDGAVAAAWLAGDLDPAAAARFEARLAADPAAAAQLEAVAETVLRLRAPDAVPLPPGYPARLRTRLAAERTSPGTQTPSASTGPGGAGGAGPGGAAGRGPGSARERGAGARPPGREGAGARRRVPNAVLSAAALGLVGVLGLAALATRLPGLLGGGEGSTSAEVMAEAEDAAPEAPSAALEDRRGAGGAGEAAGSAGEAAESQEQGGTTSEAAGQALAPVARGAPLALGDDPTAAAAARFAGDPSAQALLGTPVAEAATLAVANRAAIAAAGPVGGTDPTACLDAALAGAGTAVPVRVEALSVDGVPALAHVVAVADPADPALTRVEVRILRADSCASLATAPG